MPDYNLADDEILNLLRESDNVFRLPPIRPVTTDNCISHPRYRDFVAARRSGREWQWNSNEEDHLRACRFCQQLLEKEDHFVDLDRTKTRWKRAGISVLVVISAVAAVAFIAIGFTRNADSPSIYVTHLDATQHAGRESQQAEQVDQLNVALNGWRGNATVCMLECVAGHVPTVRPEDDQRCPTIVSGEQLKRPLFVTRAEGQQKMVLLLVTDMPAATDLQDAVQRGRISRFDQASEQKTLAEVTKVLIEQKKNLITSTWIVIEPAVHRER